MSEVLISVPQLADLVGDERVALVDCRFVLGQPQAGRDAYLEAHIPGAVYAHLETTLSGPPATDHGRHPLPAPARLRAVFGELGITAGVRVVAYDDSYGMVAARLWWMLRYMGHADVAVLDGGWQAWAAAGLSVQAGMQTRNAQVFNGEPQTHQLVQIDAVESCTMLIDAREPARFRGEVEPIDPVAGHIPGAHNLCWRDNLGADGCFHSASALRERFERVLGTLPDGAATHYCGSGVSACHNVLAQVAAGLPEPRLYCGSWSEWCRVMIDTGPGR